MVRTSRGGRWRVAGRECVGGEGIEVMAGVQPLLWIPTGPGRRSGGLWVEGVFVVDDGRRKG